MFQKIFMITIIALTILILTACAMPKSLVPVTSTPAPTLTPPTVKPMPETTIAPDLQPMADKAASILSKSLDVPADQVKILEVKAVQWSDASLGCPEPDMMYAQVITPGYQARAQVGGQEYLVHLDKNGRGVHCAPDIARDPIDSK